MKTFVLTGAASGIGAALSAQLNAAGDNVISVDIKDADIITDLSVKSGREAAVAAISSLAPNGVDGFVPLAGLGAGTGHPATLMTSLNFFGAIEMTEGLRPLLAKNSGAIVMVSSNSGPMSSPEDPLIAPLLAGDEEAALKIAEKETGLEYMIGKRALVYWLRRNAFDYGRDGIRINGVAPGPIDTPMVASLRDTPGMMDAVNSLLALTPFERLGEPDEVANTIRFLLNEEASYISGTVIFVDGGYDAATRTDHL